MKTKSISSFKLLVLIYMLFPFLMQVIALLAETKEFLLFSIWAPFFMFHYACAALLNDGEYLRALCFLLVPLLPIVGFIFEKVFQKNRTMYCLVVYAPTLFSLLCALPPAVLGGSPFSILPDLILLSLMILRNKGRQGRKTGDGSVS